MQLLKLLRHHWRSVLIFLIPLGFLPLALLYELKIAKCGYVMIIVGLFWVFELFPIAVTSFLPAILLPLLGIASASSVCNQYFKSISFLLIGSLSIACAIERWNLHKRIALRVLLTMGTRPSLLLLAFILVTAFISMWLTNTATAAMMVPIAHAVVSELRSSAKRASRLRQRVDGDVAMEMTTRPAETTLLSNPAESEQIGLMFATAAVPAHNCPPMLEGEDGSEDAASLAETREYDNLLKALVISIAYSSSLGGSATLIGSNASVIMKEIVDSLWPDNDLTFTSYMIFNLPTAVLMTFCCWVWMFCVFLGPRRFFRCRSSDDSQLAAYRHMRVVIRRNYDDLGPISWAEVGVAVHFGIVVLLWLTRNPGFFPGWSQLFGKNQIDDSVSTLLVVCSLFVFPAYNPRKPRSVELSNGQRRGLKRKSETLLEWDVIQKNLPWGIIIMIGAGFALAFASEKSGLSQFLGEKLTFMLSLPRMAMLFIIVTITALLTEVTSNAAVVTILLPIVAKLSLEGGIHPLYLMVPTTTASTLAFMLPVATPPNAVAFSYGGIRIIDMVKAGVGMNIIGVVLVTLSAHTWGQAGFQLDRFPDWALSGLQNMTFSTPMPNSTSAA